MSEKAVKLAARLYEARDVMRLMWGKDYKAKIAEYDIFIDAQMRKAGHKDPLKATMELVKDLQIKCPDSGIGQAMILAAYVERIEPTK